MMDYLVGLAALGLLGKLGPGLFRRFVRGLAACGFRPGNGVLLRQHLGWQIGVLVGRVPEFLATDLARCASEVQRLWGVRPATPSHTEATDNWGILVNLKPLFGFASRAALELELETSPGEFQRLKQQLYFLHYEGCALALEVHGGCFQVGYSKGKDHLEVAARFSQELRRLVSRRSRFRGCLIATNRSSAPLGVQNGSVEIVCRPGSLMPILDPELERQLDEALVAFMRQRHQLHQLGMASKRGLLLTGPPGTGKTSIVRWLLHTAPEFSAVLVRGETPQDIRASFELARLMAPSIVVIEDVDLIGVNRYANGLAPFLGALMTEMDGLQSNDDVFILMTSNDSSEMEAALVRRPGRVDSIVEVGLPATPTRRRMLQSYFESSGLAGCLDFEMVAQQSEGLSPACLREVFQRGVVRALEEQRGLCTDDLIRSLAGVRQQVRDPHERPRIGLRSA